VREGSVQPISPTLLDDFLARTEVAERIRSDNATGLYAFE
jgi:hypothetical protein